jgi:hypothetical protein
MEPIVEPNPSFSIFRISAFGMAVRARKSETRKSEMNAFNFILDVRNIMANILVSTSSEVVNTLIGL